MFHLQNTSGPTFADRKFAHGLDNDGGNNDGGMKQSFYSLVHSMRILRCEVVHMYKACKITPPESGGRGSKTFILHARQDQR